MIILTGTPGTGKTVIARALAKNLNYQLVEVKKTIDENKKLYRMKNSERVVDLNRLKIALIKKINGADNVILENHLLCEFNLAAKFVFVLRCNPKVLKKRLQNRKYSKEKIEENVLAEMLDYCTLLVRKNYKKSKIIELDTTKRNVNKCVVEIINVIKGKKKKIDDVNYSKELKQVAIGH